MANKRVYMYKHEVAEAGVTIPSDIIVRSTTLEKHRVWSRRRLGAGVNNEEWFLDYRKIGQILPGGSIPLYLLGLTYGTNHFTSDDVRLFIQTYDLWDKCVFQESKSLPTWLTPELEQKYQGKSDLFVMVYTEDGQARLGRFKVVEDANGDLGIPLEDGGEVCVRQGVVFEADVYNQRFNRSLANNRRWKVAVQDDLAGWIDFDRPLAE